MARLFSKATAVILALLLEAWLPTTALASAPWIAGCSGQPNANYLCIYRDWHWEGSVLGHMAGGNTSYLDETYPGSTSPVNNSISSTKNLYGNSTVTWLHDIGGGGNYLFVCQNTGVYSVGLFHNDQFSSHQVFQQTC